jgi:regulator of protease activity HflC (stomatin/prohibitin superfamily)
MSRVEITDVQVVDQEFADSMRRQAQAERERRGTIIDAEANAQSIKLDAEAQALRVRLEADALLYKAQKQAEAIRVTAEAQAWALATKGVSLETEGAKFAQQSEILRAQVEALESLGGSSNSKFVVVPAELIQTAASIGAFLRK